VQPFVYISYYSPTCEELGILYFQCDELPLSEPSGSAKSYAA